MRTLFIVGWLFAGLAGVIYHFGPGQEHLEVDRINRVLDEARTNVSLENYQTALAQFDQVMADLPEEKAEVAQRVLLEKTKAQMMAAQLPAARATLESMLSDLRGDESSDPELVADVQSTLANAQYYMTWLMRLEGLPEEEWMPEIEAARQHYTELNVKASSRGDRKTAERAAEDLESAVRLARMDLNDLKALPLPSQ
ncbi:MAG: hypothetical protein AAFN77_18655 [Planctomycetota bacterium]